MNTYFFVYILQSLKDSSFYVGQCCDLDCRMSKHTEGMSKYTASKRPLRLRYFEIFSTRTEAIKREKEIKRMKSRKYIEGLLSKWPSGWWSSDPVGRKCVYGKLYREFPDNSGPSPQLYLIHLGKLYREFPDKSGPSPQSLSSWRTFFMLQKSPVH